MTFELVVIGLCCSLEPIPLTAFILILSTPKGTRNGAGFLAGWLVTLGLVIALTLGLTGGKPLAPSSAPSDAVLAIKITLGTALLLFAWRYHGRPAKPPSQPAWMKRMDRMNVWTAAGVGFLLQPWPLVGAAALAVTEADTSKTADVVSLVAFCLIATLSYLVIEGYALAAPEAARRRLDGIRLWIDGHRRQMIVYLSVAVGLLLISKSAYALWA